MPRIHEGVRCKDLRCPKCWRTYFVSESTSWNLPTSCCTTPRDGGQMLLRTNAHKTSELESAWLAIGHSCRVDLLSTGIDRLFGRHRLFGRRIKRNCIRDRSAQGGKSTERCLEPPSRCATSGIRRRKSLT